MRLSANLARVVEAEGSAAQQRTQPTPPPSPRPPVPAPPPALVGSTVSPSKTTHAHARLTAPQVSRRRARVPAKSRPHTAAPIGLHGRCSPTRPWSFYIDIGATATRRGVALASLAFAPRAGCPFATRPRCPSPAGATCGSHTPRLGSAQPDGEAPQPTQAHAGLLAGGSHTCGLPFGASHPFRLLVPSPPSYPLPSGTRGWPSVLIDGMLIAGEVG